MKSVNLSSRLLEKLIESVESIEKRIEECNANGHQEINWDYYNPTSRSSYEDQEQRICTYCNGILYRSLNDEERKRIDDFQASLNISMTI